MDNQASPITYPTSDNIEPELAKFLYEAHCATLVLEGLPPGSEFGIDIVSHKVGPKFKGVKMIPPGIHFVYASAIYKGTNQVGPRCGFFHNFKERELVIREWSESDEDFSDSSQPDMEKLERYSKNMHDLDRYLGAYQYSSYQIYLNLTNRLNANIVDELKPKCDKIRSAPFLINQVEETSKILGERTRRATLRSEIKPSEDNLLPHLKPDPETVINFTSIQPNSEFNASEFVEPSVVTKYHLDTTTKLDKFFKGPTGRERLLAEFQFSFIVFLLCHVYDCFENWKSLLRLICLADSGIGKYPKFFEEFIEIFRHQIEQVPEDMFDDIDDEKNIVLNYLDTFFQNVDCVTSIDGNLKKEAQDLRRHLVDKFNWTFDLERDDERPTIVD